MKEPKDMTNNELIDHLSAPISEGSAILCYPIATVNELKRRLAILQTVLDGIGIVEHHDPNDKTRGWSPHFSTYLRGDTMFDCTLEPHEWKELESLLPKPQETP